MAQHDVNGRDTKSNSDVQVELNNNHRQLDDSHTAQQNGFKKNGDQSLSLSTSLARNETDDCVFSEDDDRHQLNKKSAKASKNYVQEQHGKQMTDELGVQSDDSFTIKKGVLWQQQNYDKFHQRLFSRWKKRFFILTTDYLVCFKRTRAKVGRSEMGKFHYKVSYLLLQL